MPLSLPSFHLKRVLEQHNRETESALKQEHLKCKYLRPKLFNEHQHLIDTLNHADRLFIFTRSEMRRLRLHTEQTLLNDEWEKSAASTVHLSWQTTAVHAHTLSPEARLNYYQWLHKTQTTLDRHDDDKWANLEWANLAASQIKGLKSAWQRAHVLPTWTNAALSEVAFKQVPALEKSYQRMRRWLWAYWLVLPTSIYQAYKTHLESMLKQLHAKRKVLARAMAARLHAFSHSGLQDSNPVRQFTRMWNAQVKAAGGDDALTKALLFTPPDAHDPLTPEQFAAYHTYVASHGDQATRADVRLCAWFKGDHASHLRMDSTTSHPAYVRLTAKIPTRLKWPNW